MSTLRSSRLFRCANSNTKSCSPSELRICPPKGCDPGGSRSAKAHSLALSAAPCRAVPRRPPPSSSLLGSAPPHLPRHLCCQDQCHGRFALHHSVIGVVTVAVTVANAAAADNARGTPCDALGLCADGHNPRQAPAVIVIFVGVGGGSVEAEAGGGQ